MGMIAAGTLERRYGFLAAFGGCLFFRLQIGPLALECINLFLELVDDVRFLPHNKESESCHGFTIQLEDVQAIR